MQDSKSNSVTGNPVMETGIQWLRFYFIFPIFFFFVVKVARYNTVLARFRDNPATIYYDVAYDFLFHLIKIVTMETNQECMNTIINLSITFRL